MTAPSSWGADSNEIDLTIEEREAFAVLGASPHKAASVEQELREALEIQDDYNDKLLQMGQVEEDSGDMNVRLETMEGQLEAIEEQIKALEDQRKGLLVEKKVLVGERKVLDHQKSRLSSQISSLKDLPQYRNASQIDCLIVKLGVIQSGPAMDVGADNSRVCPVCFDEPRQVFCCVECDNWVCGACKGMLPSCPSCRQDFGKKPPKRNKAVERFLGI